MKSDVKLSCQGKPAKYKFLDNPIPFPEDGVLKWHLNNFTPDMPKHEQLIVLRDVFASFNKRLYPLSIEPTENKEEAYFQIYFVRKDGKAYNENGTKILDSPYIFEPGVLAVAYSAYGGEYQGYQLINEDFFWQMKHGGEGYKLPLVLEHEFGHNFGLDHTDVEDDLMYPSYDPNNNWTEDSEKGLFELYKKQRYDTIKRLYGSKLFYDYLRSDKAKINNQEKPSNNHWWIIALAFALTLLAIAANG